MGCHSTWDLCHLGPTSQGSAPVPRPRRQSCWVPRHSNSQKSPAALSTSRRIFPLLLDQCPTSKNARGPCHRLVCVLEGPSVHLLNLCWPNAFRETGSTVPLCTSWPWRKFRGSTVCLQAAWPALSTDSRLPCRRHRRHNLCNPLRFYLSSKVFDLGQRPLTLRRGLASW